MALLARANIIKRLEKDDHDDDDKHGTPPINIEVLFILPHS